MKYRITILACLAAALPVQAETDQDKGTQGAVLACFAGMGTSSDWNTCLNTMFAPCAAAQVGSDPHLECLIEVGNGWRASQKRAETEVMGQLTAAGAETLGGLLGAWPKFVDEKCFGVAQGRAGISFDAALIGCQISEYALMTNELTACAEGRSTEAYCQKK